MLEFSLRISLPRVTVYWIVLNSLKTWEVFGIRAKCRKPNASVHTEEAEGPARETLIRSPKKCTRRLAQQIGASSSTARKICRDGLPLSPYRMQLSQLREIVQGVQSITGVQSEFRCHMVLR